MIFTILGKTDLAPLMEIDDFISVVWNNKYYTAGDFEINIQTTPERIEKVVRDNYITLNGSDEIAIIELITFSEDEEKGAIMTVTGTFAQSMLNRRIIWDKAHLAGKLGEEVRNLIDINALNPADSFRSLNKDIVIGTRTGKSLNFITDREPFMELRQIQYTGYTAITPGTLSDGVKSGETVTHDYLQFNILGDGGGETGATTFNNKDGDSVKEIYSNPVDDEIRPILFWTKDKCRLTTKTHGALIWDIFSGALGSGLDYIGDFSLNKVDGIYILEFSSRAKDINDEELDDQTPYSDNMAGLSKDEYNAGGYGLTIFDNALHVRCKVGQASIDALENMGYPYGSKAFNRLLLQCILGYRDSGANDAIFNSKSLLIYNIKQSEEVELTPTTAISWGAYTWFYVTHASGGEGTFYCEFIKSITENNIYSLGNNGGATDYVELELHGDNLLEKCEELLELYGTGIKACYDKAEKKIYLDIYKGADNSNNIVFAESLDNLNGYTVNLATGGANVALVYSKDGDIEYTGTAGAGAGMDRREIFVNKTDSPGYVGNSYTQQLEEEGKLYLQGVKITIESEIDANSYLYRAQYNVGDIVKLIIKDLGLEYVIRVLEVREYQDESGYSIDLVLGE